MSNSSFPRNGWPSASSAPVLRVFALTALILLFGQPGYALDKTWNNTGTDFNATGNWTGGVPGSGDAAIFSAAMVTNPNLSASLTIDHLEFSTAGASGYNLSSSSSIIKLTLLNTTTGTNAAIRSAITSGTNTIDAPIVLGAASGQTQTFNQSSGGMLVVNGVISSTNTVGLSLRDGGTIQLNGANTYTGNTSIDTNSQTLILGNDNALATGTFTNNALGATLQAGGGARSISNAVALAANLTISGTDNLTLSGVVSGGSALTKSGSGTLTLSNTNTYTGSTTVSAGTLTLSAGGAGALGSTASVTVNSGGTLLLGASDQIKNTATMTLAGGTFNKGSFSEGAINSAGIGALTLTSAGSHIDFGIGTVGVLNFASFNPGTNTLVIDNWTGTVNTVGSASTDRLIFNTSQAGNLNNFSFAGYAPGATQFDLGGGYYEITPTAVPEPSTYAAALLALGAIGYLQRRRLRNSQACLRDFTLFPQRHAADKPLRAG